MTGTINYRLYGKTVMLLVLLCLFPTTMRALTFDTGTCEYMINPDNETVTLIRVSRDRYNVFPQFPSSGKVEYNGKWYPVTGVGDGYNPISNSGVAVENAFIGDHIKRINDYALAVSGTNHFGMPQSFLISRTNRIEYLGKVQTGYIDEFFVNTECEIDSTGSRLKYMQLGTHKPKLLTDGGIFYRIDTIRCTSATPLDIDGPLLTYEPGYNLTILIIPDGSKEAYAAHKEWGKFRIMRTESEQKQWEADEPGKNFCVKTDDGARLYYRINDDNPSTVTLVATADCYEVLDLSQPVINPNTGIKYTLTGIGNGRSVSLVFSHVFITPNILSIYDEAGLEDVTIPNNTSLRYIGANAIRSADVLHIPDGCVFKGSVFKYGMYVYTTDYMRIGNGTKLGSHNTNIIWDCQTIRVDAPTPPPVESEGIFPDAIYGSQMLFVPKGCVQAYKDDAMWGKFKHIYEFDKPRVISPAYDELKPTESTFAFKTVSNIAGYNPEDMELQCAINRDGTSVTVQGIDKVPAALVVPAVVTHPETGKSYDVKVLNFTCSTKFIQIPSSVMRIEQELEATENYRIESPNNLIYLARNAINFYESYFEPFTINDGCIINGLTWLPKDLTIGNIEYIGPCVYNDYYSYIFGSRYFSNLNPDEQQSIRFTTAMPPAVIGHELYYDRRVYEQTTLYVPKGTKTIYSNAPEWSRFKNIEEYEPGSGIDAPDTDTNAIIKVASGSGELVITADAPTDATIFDISGRTVKRLHLNEGTNTVQLQSGIYIVAAKDYATCKAMVY